MEYTLNVRQNGFHGWASVPVRGSGWRAWNESLIAVEMDEAAVQAMYATAACGVSGCECGGLHCAQPVGSNLHAFPLSWVDEADRDACPDLAAADAQCQKWLRDALEV